MKNKKWIIIGIVVIGLFAANSLINRSGWIESERARIDSLKQVESAQKAKELLEERMSPSYMKFAATEYLKKNLHDPKSYESVSWSEVSTKDSISFVVSHQYRAKNKFGGLVLEEKTFVLNRLGEVVRVE